MTMRLLPEQPVTPGRRPAAFLLLLAVYVLLLAGYVGLRFLWTTLDDDAIRLTALSRNVLVEGTLAPRSGAYPYGYTYPTLNTFLVHLTGLPLATIQVYVQPFLVTLLVPVSFIAYRSLTGSSVVALLAALLLFLSPEFLFEATRSSHAKVTWLLALTMLFILARSFGAGQAWRRLAPWVIAFYLATFALITSSAFFGSNYLFGIAFAFAMTYMLLRLRRTRGAVTTQMRRLSYVTVATLLLAFLFIFYLYGPALSVFNELQKSIDRVLVFVLGVEAESGGANPYAYTQRTWLSPWAYLALTAFNWFVLLLSFAVWLRQGWALWMRRVEMPGHRLLLWLLYGSFGLLLALSVLLDLAGALSANLQLRIFPHLLLVGIPLAAEGLVAGLRWARRSQRRALAVAAPLALVLLLSYFSLASLFKVTNEPLLSHWWRFYDRGEELSVQWVDSHVRNNQVWAGRDFRLPTVALAYGNWRQQRIRVDRSANPITARYVLWSDISQMRADRAGETLPDTRQFSRVYDAGGAALYYSRPKTPYQR